MFIVLLSLLGFYPFKAGPSFYFTLSILAHELVLTEHKLNQLSTKLGFLLFTKESSSVHSGNHSDLWPLLLLLLQRRNSSRKPQLFPLHQFKSQGLPACLRQLWHNTDAHENVWLWCSGAFKPSAMLSEGKFPRKTSPNNSYAISTYLGVIYVEKLSNTTCS